MILTQIKKTNNGITATGGDIRKNDFQWESFFNKHFIEISNSRVFIDTDNNIFNLELDMNSYYKDSANFRYWINSDTTKKNNLLSWLYFLKNIKKPELSPKIVSHIIVTKLTNNLNFVQINDINQNTFLRGLIKSIPSGKKLLCINGVFLMDSNFESVVDFFKNNISKLTFESYCFNFSENENMVKWELKASFYKYHKMRYNRYLKINKLKNNYESIINYFEGEKSSPETLNDNED